MRGKNSPVEFSPFACGPGQTGQRVAVESLPYLSAPSPPILSVEQPAQPRPDIWGDRLKKWSRVWCVCVCVYVYVLSDRLFRLYLASWSQHYFLPVPVQNTPTSTHTCTCICTLYIMYTYVHVHVRRYMYILISTVRHILT